MPIQETPPDWKGREVERERETEREVETEREGDRERERGGGEYNTKIMHFILFTQC